MTQNSYKFFFFLLFFSATAFCQLDNLKWQKAVLSYEKSDNSSSAKYSFESDDVIEFVTKTFANAYWFFVSDYAGDNCPFRPSCSVFFVEAVEKTDIFQASLMFFDRFTRDMNFVKGYHHYPMVKKGYFYDPPENYTLNQDKINYIPPEFILDDK